MDLFCLELCKSNVGKTFSSTKVRYTWTFEKDSQPHEVYATNSTMSGKKQVYLDGYLIHSEKKYAGFNFSFMFQKEYNLTFQQVEDSIQLYINGTLFQKLKLFQKTQKKQYKQITQSMAASQARGAKKEVMLESLKEDDDFVKQQQQQLEHFAQLKKQKDILTQSKVQQLGQDKFKGNFEQFDFGNFAVDKKEKGDFQFKAEKEIDDELDLLCLEDEDEKVLHLEGGVQKKEGGVQKKEGGVQKKEEDDFATKMAISEIYLPPNKVEKKDNPFDDLLLDEEDNDLDIDLAAPQQPVYLPPQQFLPPQQKSVQNNRVPAAIDDDLDLI